VTRARLVVAVVVVLVVGVLVGARAWVRGQDYLEPGTAGQVPAGARVQQAEFPEPDEPEEVAIVRYRDGARVRYGLSVRNHGPFAIKITEVSDLEAPDETVFLFRPIAVRMGEDNQSGTGARLPFRPFTLEPGHERYLEVIGQLGDCEYWEPGSAEIIDSEGVRFEVLGQSLEDRVALGTSIEFRAARAGRCPRERSA
jgi:hypothetical protein